MDNPFGQKQKFALEWTDFLPNLVLLSTDAFAICSQIHQNEADQYGSLEPKVQQKYIG